MMRGHERTFAPFLAVAMALVAGTGCLVGPDYETPTAPTSESWMDPGDPSIRREPGDLTAWWQVFHDPVLDRLVDTASRQNLTLVAAATRVLEAQAVSGIAYGLLFPQQQVATGGMSFNSASENAANALPDPNFQQWQVGLSAAWELDVFGRFRRGIESAEAEVLASIASYDDVLVSLVAQVGADYIQLRTLAERLVVAHANVDVQRRALDIALARFQAGTTTELDSAQATSLLHDTEALIPALETAIRQTENSLCTLLGIPPRDLHDLLGEAGIPEPPPSISVGIPADLLRRRPDIRRSERLLASQCARIGIAKADLYPSFSLLGTVNFVSEHPGDLLHRRSLDASFGPAFSWPILNYGRIENNVRAQDAEFQALISDYRSTVLRAQEDVESSISGFLGARRQSGFLGPSVDAARRAVDIAVLQYQGGTADYTRVLDTQQFLAQEQDRLVTTKGQVALGLVSLYRALGGGWEQRPGQPPIPDDILDQMRARTNWGDMLPTRGASTATVSPESPSPAPPR